MTGQAAMGAEAADPLDLAAVVELASRLAGGCPAGLRLTDDGYGRPAVWVYPSGASWPEAEADAAETPVLRAIALHGPEEEVIGTLALFDATPRDLPAGVDPLLALLARSVAAALRLAAEAGVRLENPAAAPVACGAFALFARLRIGEVQYDMGRCDTTDRLAFRHADKAEDWVALMHGFAEGWPDIAAEIIARTRNATRDYIRMHMIRHGETTATEGERDYDLYGIPWRVRGTVDGAEVWQAESGDWQAFDTTPIAESPDPRDLAAQALMAALPDLEDRIGQDVRDWARRLAQGSQVSPVLNAA